MECPFLSLSKKNATDESEEAGWKANWVMNTGCTVAGSGEPQCVQEVGRMLCLRNAVVQREQRGWWGASWKDEQ